MTPHAIKLTAEQQRLVREAARIELARRSTVDAARWRDPQVVAIPWQRELGADVCDRLVTSAIEGTGLRVTCSAPPRHGKSEFTGRAMPIRAYLEAVAHGREFSILYVTSNGGRAREVSARVRSAIERLYAFTKDEVFAPGRIWTDTEWETLGREVDGRRVGMLSWTAFGWEARTGGVGANLLIMDDMLGSSVVYRSESKRLQLRRAVQEDLLSRLVQGGSAIQMETRRGTEDTTAWLLREFPGVWERHVWKTFDGERGTGDGAYLWPDQYGEAWRATMPHLTDGSPIWRSLYQQEPVPEGGSLIEEGWVTATYPEPPEVVRNIASFVSIGVDLASTKKTTSDHVAMVVTARRQAYRDVLHVVRRRMGYVEQKRMLKDLVATWRPHAVVVELAAGGHQLVEELQSEIPGVVGHAPGGRDKVVRLTPHLPRFAAGQVRLPASGAPWVGPWREELTGFTGLDDGEDDQVDATVWALEGCEMAPQVSAKQVSQAIGRVFG